jgi:glycine betaine/choline ABC-type transport system substrate-binding protein
MLSGARNHRDSALSQKFYDRMKSLFPDQKSLLIAASVLVSNTYSSVGNEQQAHEVHISRIKQFGKKSKAGISWTEVNGELVVSA